MGFDYLFYVYMYSVIKENMWIVIIMYLLILGFMSVFNICYMILLI